MKYSAIVCLFLVTFYGCGFTTSNSSNSLYDDYREDQLTKAVVGGILLCATGYLLIVIMEADSKKISETMKSWKGAPVTRLIRSWGPPQDIVSDGAQGKIYIYSKLIDRQLAPGTIKRKGTYGDGFYTERIEVKPPRRLKYKRVRMFWVNKRGIIYHWMWKGH